MNFREYLPENEKVHKFFLSVHMGPRSNLLSQKNGQRSRDTVPLMLMVETRERLHVMQILCCLVWRGSMGLVFSNLACSEQDSLI